MLVFLLYLRFILSSPVLVLSNRKWFKESPIVVTYMSRNDIPWNNWKHYKDWKEGECNGDRDANFTKLYLWEDSWSWIKNGNWNKGKLLENLKICNDIIEINIDGGYFYESRWKLEEFKDEDKKTHMNWANNLVERLKKESGRIKKITWYDNSVYGMNSLFGPYKDTKKFTWTPDQKGKDDEQVVQWQEYKEFNENMIRETCAMDGKCYGLMVAYSKAEKIACDTVILEFNLKHMLSVCKKTYHEYTFSRAKDGETYKLVDDIEPLVEYLKSMKNNTRKQLTYHEEL